MRRARLKGEPEAEAAYYHCISRVVDRRFILDAPQKEAFVRFMRGYETYCGVQIITFCVMSNHFHVLLRGNGDRQCFRHCSTNKAPLDRRKPRV